MTETATQTQLKEVVVNTRTKSTIAQITRDHPWIWLSRGWQDLLHAPSVGLGYGALFSAAGLIILYAVWATDYYGILPALAGGFLLVAPVLAVGLYETSRRLEKGEPVSMKLALTAWRRNFDQVTFMGMFLAVFYMAWMQLAFLIFMAFFSGSPPNPANLIQELFFSWSSVPFLIFGTAVGAVLASFVFSCAAISIPMLIDRDVNFVEAMSTSIKCVKANPFPMFVWACLIALFTIAGILTFFIGLTIMLPLIGHATWHAYRDLLSFED